MSSAGALRTYSGRAIMRHREVLRELYAETFSRPPWNEPERYADVFVDRLETVSGSHGFRAIVAELGDTVLGFAYGLSTPDPLPATRLYDELAEALGFDRLLDHVIGAFEVEELAVAAPARRQGLGRRLLETLLETSPHERAWLLTSAQAVEAMSFYERLGWRQVLPRPTPIHGLLLYVFPDPDRK